MTKKLWSTQKGTVILLGENLGDPTFLEVFLSKFYEVGREICGEYDTVCGRRKLSHWPVVVEEVGLTQRTSKEEVGVDALGLVQREYFMQRNNNIIRLHFF